MKKPFNRGILLFLLTVIIWGSTFVITKYLMKDLGPFLVVGLRIIIALIVITPFAYQRGFQWKMIKENRFILFGLTGVALYFGLANAGLALSTAANASLIQAAIPAVVALLSVIILKEGFSIQRGIGIGLSILGVLLVSGLPAEQGASTFFGNILILGSVVAWGVYTIQSKILSGDIDPLVSTTASFYTGLVWLLPFIGWEISRSGLPIIPAISWLSLLYLGMIASALAYFLWNQALTKLDASTVGPFLNLIPIIGLLFAIFSGEHVTFPQIIGGLLAIIGVMITQNLINLPKGPVNEISSLTN
jgi:drug/metabolite transporter (DMT)-like permease